MEIRRMRQRLRDLTRAMRGSDPISQDELDENTAALIDAVLQSLVFCLALLALVTCLQRLPRLPAPGAHAAPMAWPESQGMLVGFSG